MSLATYTSRTIVSIVEAGASTRGLWNTDARWRPYSTTSRRIITGADYFGDNAKLVRKVAEVAVTRPPGS